MFNSVVINKFIEDNKNDFIENIFGNLKETGFQYIRDLLVISKGLEKELLKKQIQGYQRIIDHIVSSDEFKPEVEIDEFTEEEHQSEINNRLLKEGHEYFLKHVSARVDKYVKIIQLSNELLTYVDVQSTEENLEVIINNLEMDVYASMRDVSRKRNFYKAILRLLLRNIKSEKDKVVFIKAFIDEPVNYNSKIKSLYYPGNKPVVINSVVEYLKLINEFTDDNFYRGHSSARYQMVPSVYRDGLFYFEDQLIKDMLLELPEEFPSDTTHYERLMKMQHYGIPTKLLDITSNPLVALFMACDGDEDSEGEVIPMESDSFDVCYPSSDKIKIMTSIPFLPFSTKTILAYLLERSDVTNKTFNQLAKALLHEIKHEMPAFEARMNKEDLRKYLIVLGPKKNKRINAQSGHFIVAPLTLKTSTRIPFKHKKIDGKPVRIIVPLNRKESILKELKKLNIRRSTMYPEIEHVAKEIKAMYL